LSTWFDISRLTCWVLFLLPAAFFVSSLLDVTELEKKIIYSFFYCFSAFIFLWTSMHFFVTSTRPSAGLNDPNVLSGLILFFLFPAIQLTLFTKNKETSHKRRVFVYSHLYLFIGFYAFFATASRSGLLAFIVVSFLLFIKIIKDTKFIKTKELLLIGLIVISTFVLTTQQKDYFSDRGIASFAQDTGVQSRIQLWKTSIDMAKDNSLFGSGLGTFPIQYKRNRSINETSSSGQFAHNDYLQFLVEGGLFQFVFIVILSFIIIWMYFKLFLTKSTDEDNHENLFKFTLLSSVCVFFIQANANFIFYMAPNVILIGITLGYVSKDKLFKTSTIELKNIWLCVCFSIFGFALVIFALDLHIQTKYYATPNAMETNTAQEYYESSNLLSIVRPNSKALARYRFLFNLNELDGEEGIDETHEKLDKLLKSNPNDAFAMHFLARFALNNPDLYLKFKERYPSSAYYATPKSLFYNSLKDDPGLLPSYFQLRLLYIKNEQRQKAYALFKEKLLPRFKFGEIPLIRQAPIIEVMLEDAEELYLVNDVVEYASILLHIDTCNEVALKAVGAQKPEKCTLRFRN